MNAFPASIKFKHSWRDYQECVLNELEEHLDDKKLHIIAPPGSGKTVLGLEVVRRLNRPTLILSPTIAIRNQWKDRFIGLFISDGGSTVDWISHDIHAPALLDSLVELKIIKTPVSKLEIITGRDNSGSAHCFLEGATYFEASRFRAALLEILGPVDNPRYLIVRKNPLLTLQRIDFHPVPVVLSQKRENAEFFLVNGKGGSVHLN